jgi:hypothetical protein
MRLTFIGNDPESNSEGETCVEIPDRMLQFIGQGDRGLNNG